MLYYVVCEYHMFFTDTVLTIVHCRH